MAVGEEQVHRERLPWFQVERREAEAGALHGSKMRHFRQQLLHSNVGPNCAASAANEGQDYAGIMNEDSAAISCARYHACVLLVCASFATLVAAMT